MSQNQQLDEFLQNNIIDYENSLKLKETRKLFKQFLQTEFNTEHIDFLDAVEYYHNCVLQFYNSLNGTNSDKKENGSTRSVFGSVICDVLELKDAEPPQLQTQIPKKKKGFSVSPSAIVEEMEEDEQEDASTQRKSVGKAKNSEPSTLEELRIHIASHPLTPDSPVLKDGKRNSLQMVKETENESSIRQIVETEDSTEEKNNEPVPNQPEKPIVLVEPLKDQEEEKVTKKIEEEDEDDEDEDDLPRIRKSKSVGPGRQFAMTPRSGKGSAPTIFKSQFRSDGLQNLISNLHNNKQIFRKNDFGEAVPEFDMLADEIIEDYIVEDAIKQINISFELKCQIQELRAKLKDMDLKEKKEQQYHLFSKAEDLVTFELHDNFTRFLRSPQFRKFLLTNLKNEDLMSKIARPVGKSSIYYSVDEFFDPTIKNRDFDFAHQLCEDSPDWSIMFEDKYTCLFVTKKCYLLESGSKQFMMDQKQLLQNLITTKLVYTIPAHFEVAFALKNGSLTEDKISKYQVHGTQPTKISHTSGKHYSCTTVIREMEMSFPFSNREFVNIVTAKKFEATDKIPERIVVIAKPTDDSQVPKFNSKNERAVLYYSQIFYKISDNTTRVIQCKMINVGGSATNISKPMVKKALKSNAEKERRLINEAILQLMPTLAFAHQEPSRTKSGRSITDLQSEKTSEMDEEAIAKHKAKQEHRRQVLQDLNTCKLFEAYLENQKPVPNVLNNVPTTPDS